MNTLYWNMYSVHFSHSVMSNSLQLFANRLAAHQASLSVTNSRSLLKLTSIELLMPSSHLILSSPSPPAFILLSIRVFHSVSVLCIRWPKYWSFSFSISPSNEYSGLISFSIDWFDLLEDSQESSPTPQFKSINSLALSHQGGPRAYYIP